MSRTTAYYNELDPYAAQWLRNLIDAGHIAPGVVDTRSIEDVTPHDLHGFTQAHWFAGIGGWSLALRLAGWPDDRPVWTGSCPCQPFSAAGAGAGFADERHLWPAWFHLLEQCRPPVVFGEQVASKAVDAWIDLVHADLEGVGYQFGGVAFPAAGIGAPHIRDRTYWMAHSDHERRVGERLLLRPEAARWLASHILEASWRGSTDGLADTHSWEQQGLAVVQGNERHGTHGGWSEGVSGASTRHDVCGMADASGLGRIGRRPGEARNESSQVERPHGFRDADGMGNAECDRLRSSGRADADIADESGHRAVHAAATPGPGPTNGQWGNADWLRCTDGKWRAVEPGTFPLAHGVSGRVGRLRAYGNAIVPAQAAEFIRAALG